MPPPGGGQGVGGPPRSGAEIMTNMFQQAEAKPLDAQQQASNLQQQARTQEQQRDTVRQSETHQPQETARDSSSAERARGPDQPPPTEMDAFLSHSSSQQQQRDAGRTLTRPQTMSSINAQGWSVANSPNTPDAARTLLQQRQQTPQQQGNALNQLAQGQRAPTGSAATGTQPRAMPMPQRAPMGTPERSAAPLIIQYARTYSSGGETAARAFTGRAFSPENFLQQVQRQIFAQMGGSAQQFMSQTAQVAVHVRGNLVFVKDGKELRAFRLNKDGTLTELLSEDSGEHPLSPEARSLLGKVLGQRSLQARKEGSGMKEADKLHGHESEAAQAEHAKEEADAASAPLDFETRFALLLHEVLEEGRDLEKSLNGEDPCFPAKGDWEAFFARMLKMGSQEKGTKKAMEAVLAMIFRGTFKKEGQGNVLVGDLKYLNDAGKTKEEKFAQIAFDDEKLLALLAKLKPGQKISPESLKDIFGDELSYVELAHLAEQLQMNQAEAASKNVIFNPKGNVDAFSQARLERSIFGNRKNLKTEVVLAEGSSAGASLLDPGPSTFSANIYELLGLRERYRGRPRLYTFVLYSMMAAIAMITIGILVLKVV